MKKEFLILAIAIGSNWQRKTLAVIAACLAVLAASYLTGCSAPLDSETDTEGEYSKLTNDDSNAAASAATSGGEYVESVEDDCESDVDALLAEIEQLKIDNQQLKYETALAYQTSREFEQALRVTGLKYETILDEYRVLQTWVVDNQCPTLSREVE